MCYYWRISSMHGRLNKIIQFGSMVTLPHPRKTPFPGSITQSKIIILYIFKSWGIHLGCASQCDVILNCCAHLLWYLVVLLLWILSSNIIKLSACVGRILEPSHTQFKKGEFEKTMFFNFNLQASEERKHLKDAIQTWHILNWRYEGSKYCNIVYDD